MRGSDGELPLSAFGRVTLPAGAFVDANLPKGYAPFNVQVLGDKVYVTYAKQDKFKHDDAAGPHRGFVDVFNLDGTPGLANGNERLVSRGALDSPWGLALTPSSFGNLSGDPLVGNFGNGRINVYDPATGKFLGGLKDPDGEPIQIDGLWALKVGNGKAGGDANTLYFTAGLFGETHGLFGSLAPVAAGTPEGPAEEQMVQASLDVFQLSLDTLKMDIAGGASRGTIRQDLKAVRSALVDLIHAEARFADDALDDVGGGRHEGKHSSHGGTSATWMTSSPARTAGTGCNLGEGVALPPYLIRLPPTASASHTAAWGCARGESDQVTGVT